MTLLEFSLAWHAEHKPNVSE